MIPEFEFEKLSPDFRKRLNKWINEGFYLVETLIALNYRETSLKFNYRISLGLLKLQSFFELETDAKCDVKGGASDEKLSAEFKYTLNNWNYEGHYLIDKLIENEFKLTAIALNQHILTPLAKLRREFGIGSAIAKFYDIKPKTGKTHRVKRERERV